MIRQRIFAVSINRHTAQTNQHDKVHNHYRYIPHWHGTVF